MLGTIAIFEERRMLPKHPGYAACHQRTRRFLPPVI